MVICYFGAGLTAAGAATQPAYPSKPIRIVAPAHTPDAILDKLHHEIVRMLQAPDVKERLAALAFTPVGTTRKEYAAFIKAEIAKWGKAVKDSGTKAD